MDCGLNKPDPYKPVVQIRNLARGHRERHPIGSKLRHSQIEAALTTGLAGHGVGQAETHKAKKVGDRGKVGQRIAQVNEMGTQKAEGTHRTESIEVSRFQSAMSKPRRLARASNPPFAVLGAP